MVRFGYTLMTEQAGPKALVSHARSAEQAGPKALVSHARSAEQAGFDFEVISDHYSPWLDSQGHAPYAWSVLGAVAEVTHSVDLMTFVTCPIMRHHPAVVAQKAATVQALADGRFTLGLGAGPICWDPDENAAVRRAHEQFRWFAGGWKVNAELPGPSGFDAATQYITPNDVAGNIPCGPDTDRIVSSVAAFWEAGFTDIALVQIGGEHQSGFFSYAERDLLPALRKAAG